MYTSAKQKSRRVLVLAGLLISLSMVAAACAGATATPPPTDGSQPEGETGQPTQAGDQQEAAPQGKIRVAMQPIVQTDPALVSSDSEVLVANHVYDYLVDIDADNNVVPRLATEWSVSEDGLTYVLTLTEGVTFHDGSNFSANDVVYTYDRLRDPEADYVTAGLYENITEVEATSDLEVTFTLASPNPFFIYDLSDNHALIVKDGTTDFETSFNGTGPFRVTNYTAEDRIEMEANPEYFVEGKPELAGLDIIFFNDETAAVNALRSGQVDLVMRMSTALFTSLQDEPGINTIDIPTNGFDLIRLRSDQEPGNDPKVIQAMKLATDRDAIFELVQQGYGAVGRDSPIGPLYTQYYSEETPLPERDPEAARQLLEEAGYPDGVSLTLHTPDTGGRPDLAAVIKDQWEPAGFDIDIVVEPESVYYGENNWLEVNFGITGWGSRPVPQFYLDVMLVCGARWNESHFCDEEFDQLVQVAGTTMDEQERVEAYEEIQRILIERGPIVIPYYFAQFAAISDQFENFELKAFAGRTDLRDVSLSTQ